MRFRIVIVTRDSTRWIGIIAKAYRDLGLRPLYLVHDKTRDDTSAILEELGEDVSPISMPFDRVESAIGQFPNLVAEEWALRLDDDEFPSRRMLAYADWAVPRAREQAIAFSRREVLRGIVPLSYATMETLFNTPLLPFHLDPQLRLFRHREVALTTEIHTPGIVPTSIRTAPSNAYMVHFNSTVRSLRARISKLARYEAETFGAGTLAAGRVSVPELVSPAELRTRAFETKEFDALRKRSEISREKIASNQSIPQSSAEFAPLMRESSRKARRA
jgi:hypothetical protein